MFLLKFFLHFFNYLFELGLTIDNFDKLRGQMFEIFSSIFSFSLGFSLKLIKFTLFRILSFIVSSLPILFGDPLESVLSLVDKAHNFQDFAALVDSSFDGVGIVGGILI